MTSPAFTLRRDTCAHCANAIEWVRFTDDSYQWLHHDTLRAECQNTTYATPARPVVSDTVLVDRSAS